MEKATAAVQGDGFSDDFWARLRTESKRESETPKPLQQSPNLFQSNDKSKESLTQAHTSAKKTQKNEAVDDEVQKPVMILAFDDDKEMDLKNPFAKKPQLAKRHKSLLE